MKIITIFFLFLLVGCKSKEDKIDTVDENTVTETEEKKTRIKQQDPRVARVLDKYNFTDGRDANAMEDINKFLDENLLGDIDRELWRICGYSVLHTAAEEDDLESVRVLVESGMDVDRRVGGEGCWTPLHYASYEGNPEVVEYLVKKGADVNALTKRGETPLDLAYGFLYTNDREKKVIQILTKNKAQHADFSLIEKKMLK